MDGGSTCSPLIDDMESGINAIPMNCGRSGQWFTYNDGFGTQTPPAALPDGGSNSFLPSLLPTPRGTSLYAAHTFGGGFTSYLGMGVTIGGPANNTNGPYDATAHGYTGFRFYAMLGSSQPNAQLVIEFHATDKYCDSAGGLCSTSTTAGTLRCYDNPKIKVSLGPVWTLVNVPFTELARTGWGYGGTMPLDPTSLYVLGFEQNYQAGNTAPFSMDVWIDDLSFTP